MITSENIFRHELIGLYLEVVYSKNNSIIGLCGYVIDETKKTLTIKLESNLSYGKSLEKIISGKRIVSEKIISKDISVFHFKLPNGEWVEIDGKILVNRPEDRIKKKYKKV
ncbi:ribonuclease P protein component 1 [Methanobrevibacter filiformis]|uniref:Ribonuclease P protein component 1 n=1 Tax=Methanobrevibacter filiformis TaxID=55758 RepID=A0A162FJ26_9EURY|nr:ribonuclease P protein component 1 [Methanobrevibacter filiformis]KZX10730.1 ribonuclease P protein component 1 [Methanobrevibacter filiformis]